MSDHTHAPNPSRPAARSVDAAFASKFPFAALTFASAEKRRKVAAKFTRVGIPADAAAAAAVMHRDASKRGLPGLRERINPAGATLSVLPRLRVIVPLIEPNVLRMARGYSRSGPTPATTQDADGTWVATWATSADHAAATSAVVKDYNDTHEVTRSIGEGQSRLDSWHNPFLLVPVRHQYRDGTEPVTRWMCADGNAMLIGARYALAADLARWGIEHPYSDPTGYWPADTATLRTVVAAAKTRLTTDLNFKTEPWPLASPIEQWADLMPPTAQVSPLTMSSWLYAVHNTNEAPDVAPASDPATSSTRFSDVLEEWVAGVDYFGGLSPEDLADVVGADPTTRTGREALALTETEVDKTILNVSSRKPTVATRIAFTAVTLTRHPAPADPADPAAQGSDFFAGYLARATRRAAPDPKVITVIEGLRNHLTTARTFPDCDLYGIWLDLIHNPFDGAPMTDPPSDWFTLTAMVGLTYAALHGHLTFPGADEVPWLDAFISTTPGPGTETVAYYAQCASQGLIPDNKYGEVARAISTATLALLDEISEAMSDTDDTTGEEGRR